MDTETQELSYFGTEGVGFSSPTRVDPLFPCSFSGPFRCRRAPPYPPATAAGSVRGEEESLPRGRECQEPRSPSSEMVSSLSELSLSMDGILTQNDMRSPQDMN